MSVILYFTVAVIVFIVSSIIFKFFDLDRIFEDEGDDGTIGSFMLRLIGSLAWIVILPITATVFLIIGIFKFDKYILPIFVDKFKPTDEPVNKGVKK